MMMRWSLSVMNFSSDLPTIFSLGVEPGRSTLVESLISASRPFLPSSPMRTRSIISPDTGVRSILKSPVCRMVPSGVVMASATESAIEWLVWMNSILKQPSLMVSPARTRLSLTFWGILCSDSLVSMMPQVRRVA